MVQCSLPRWRQRIPSTAIRILDPPDEELIKRYSLAAPKNAIGTCEDRRQTGAVHDWAWFVFEFRCSILMLDGAAISRDQIDYERDGFGSWGEATGSGRRIEEPLHGYGYPCKHPDCGQVLMTRQGLKEHQRTHTLETPYTCRYGCGRSFRWRSSLAHHEKTAHGGREQPTQLDSVEIKHSSTQDTREERSEHQGELEQGAEFESMELEEIDERRTHSSLSDDLSRLPPPPANSSRTEVPVNTGRRSFDGIRSDQKSSVSTGMGDRSQQETFSSSRPMANAAQGGDESPAPSSHAGRPLARMSSPEPLTRTQLEEPVAEWLRIQRRSRSLKLGRKKSFPHAQRSEGTTFSNSNRPDGSRPSGGEREEAKFGQMLASLLAESQQVEATSKSEFEDDGASAEKSPWNSP